MKDRLTVNEVLMWVRSASPIELAAVSRALSTGLINHVLHLAAGEVGMWCETSETAEFLKITPAYLTQLARSGKLVDGTHFKRYTLNFSQGDRPRYLWNVDACRKALGIPPEIFS